VFKLFIISAVISEKFCFEQKNGWSLFALILFNCKEFCKLLLRKIIKMVASRCHILKLKCPKFDFSWGSTPDPAGGANSAPPDPLAGFKGPTSRGKD